MNQFLLVTLCRALDMLIAFEKEAVATSSIVYNGYIAF